MSAVEAGTRPEKQLVPLNPAFVTGAKIFVRLPAKDLGSVHGAPTSREIAKARRKAIGFRRFAFARSNKARWIIF
jgi:hypothetical protein